MKLEKVFREIKKQTDYVFFYDAYTLQGAQPVSIHIKNATVEEVLEEILHGQPLGFSIEQKTITIVKKPQPEKPVETILPDVPLTIITGTVKDEKGNPLAGVSVLIKGTQGGSGTDAKGNYSISDVPPDATLVFSYVGMKTREVAVAGKSVIDIVLSVDVTALQGVVAIGYGTIGEEVTSQVLLHRSKVTIYKKVPEIHLFSHCKEEFPA